MKKGTPVCMSNYLWEVAVKSERYPDVVYRVSWDTLSGTERLRQGVEVGYTCTCPGFSFRKYGDRICKHIREARYERCAWNEARRLRKVRKDDKCPRCGGEVYYETEADL